MVRLRLQMAELKINRAISAVGRIWQISILRRGARRDITSFSPWRSILYIHILLFPSIRGDRTVRMYHRRDTLTTGTISIGRAFGDDAGKTRGERVRARAVTASRIKFCALPRREDVNRCSDLLVVAPECSTGVAGSSSRDGKRRGRLRIHPGNFFQLYGSCSTANASRGANFRRAKFAACRESESFTRRRNVLSLLADLARRRKVNCGDKFVDVRTSIFGYSCILV